MQISFYARAVKNLLIFGEHQCRSGLPWRVRNSSQPYRQLLCCASKRPVPQAGTGNNGFSPSASSAGKSGSKRTHSCGQQLIDFKQYLPFV
jgi:hypothetical protein